MRERVGLLGASRGAAGVMRVEFGDPLLRQFAICDGGCPWPGSVLARYRRRLQQLVAAPRPADLAALRCLQVQPAASTPDEVVTMAVIDDYVMDVTLQRAHPVWVARVIRVRSSKRNAARRG